MYQEQRRSLSAFRPRLNKPLVEKHLSRYNVEPERFNPMQVQILAQHANFYGLPFREITQEEADFNLFRAIRYIGEGWLQGFTTLRIGEQMPVNPYERIAKSIGRAAGYAGWLPAVGPAGFAAKAVAGKSVPLLVSKELTKRIAPRVAKAVTARAMVGGAGAVSTAAKFLSQPIAQDVALGATRLGIAGGVSGWQGGIDAMLSGMTRGMWMEAGDRLIANAVGAAVGGATGGYGAQAIVRTLSGALWNGLPSTMRKESTPDQVYEYLLGAFFAYRDEPVHSRWAKEFYVANAKDASSVKHPSALPGYKSLPTETRAIFNDIWKKNVGAEKSRNWLASQLMEAQREAMDGLPDIDKIETAVRQIEITVSALEAEKRSAAEEIAKAIDERNALEQQAQERLAPQKAKKPEVVVAGTKILLGEIPPSPRSPVGTTKTMARTSTEDDNTMQLDPSVVPERFFNRAWTKPAKYADGSQTTPLPADMFKTQEEMLAFIIEHEKAHKRIKQLPGEKQGQYEDRVNKEAAKVFQETTKEIVESGILSPEKILAPQKTQAVPRKINVWYGSNEAPEFSNLVSRPFVFEGRRYLSVEHAYQTLKSGEFDEATYGKYKRAGIKIPGTKKAAEYSDTIMEELVYESFKQNPEAAKLLIATGDAEFTHNQDKGFWKKAFPEALSFARRMLLSEATAATLTDRPQEGVALQKTQAIKPIVVDYNRYAAVPRSGDDIVFTMRQGNKVEQFGNPFSSGKGNTIRMGGVKQSVDAYVRWLSDPEAEFTDVNGKTHKHVFPERRAWILDQIDSGRLDGKKLVYYKQPDVDGGKYYSHADALRDFAYARRTSLLEATTAERENYSPKMIGGFDSSGRGTPDGDGKDKAMRQVADYFIGEIKELSDVDYETNKPLRPSKSSSETSYYAIAEKDGADDQGGNGKGTYEAGVVSPSVVMLARNSEFSGKPLMDYTKESILSAHKNGARFVVGDTPGVDDAFVRYLNEIGADYTIYHAGAQARISPKTLTPTLDQRREALSTSATKDPVKRTEERIMNEASSLRIEVTEDLLERIEADIKANGLVMAPEVTRMIAKDYLNMRNALSDYDHNKNLNQILPSGIAAGDSFLTTQLNLSNRIIVDGDTPVSNELQRLATADNRIAEIKDTKDYTEFDSVALVASREKILESKVFESDQVKRAMEAGATIITPDVIGRGDSEYWKGYEELARSFGYEDRSTGIWMKKTPDDIGKQLLNDYRRDMYTLEMIKTNSEGVTFKAKVENLITDKLKKEGKFSIQATSNLMNNFFYSVEKNPTVENVDKWIDEHPELKINDDERSMLHRYAFSRRMQEPGEIYVVDVRTNGSLPPSITTKRASGEIIAGKKLSQLWPKEKRLFSAIKGLDKVTSSPYIRISNVVVDGEMFNTTPREPKDYKTLVHHKVYLSALKNTHTIADRNLLDGGKPRAVQYYYAGGRNDHSEINLYAKHPELDSYDWDRVMKEIATATGKSVETVKNEHNKDAESFLRNFLGIKNTNDEDFEWATEYYKGSRINNLLYLRDLNGFDDFSFLGKPGFLKGSGDYNKRMQIILSTGVPIELDVFSRYYEEEVLLANKPFLPITDGALNMVVADHRFALEGEIDRTGDTALTGAALDGNVFALRSMVNATNRSFGNPISGGGVKLFISTKGENGEGMFLGKLMVHIADGDMESFMIKNGVHLIGDDNAAKQMGNRQKSNLFFDNGLLVDGELNPFQINVRDFVVVPTEMYDGNPKKLAAPSLVKQLVTTMNWGKERREDFINTLFAGSQDGDPNISAFARHLSKQETVEDVDIDYISKYVDDIGINELTALLRHPDVRVAQAVLKGIVSRNRKHQMEDVAEGFSAKLDEESYGGMKDLLEMDLPYAFFDKFAASYWQKALNKYIINRATRPKVGNAIQKMTNRGNLISRYYVTKEEFMLGGNLRAFPVDFYGMEKDGGGKFTLGELWEKREELRKSGEKKDLLIKLEEFLDNIAVERVPQDNPAGMQVLKFKGFLDVDTNDIVIHPYSKEATGGSDDDGDKYYVWMGGRSEDNSIGSGMKMSWLQEFKKNNNMWPENVGPKDYVDPKFGSASDAVFGKPNKDFLDLMNNPSLLGAPGVAEKSSSYTVFSREKLGEVVVRTTAIQQYYFNALDSWAGGIKTDGYTITPRPYDHEKAQWAVRKIAAMITKVADPTEASKIPDFTKVYNQMFFDLFEVRNKYGKIVGEDIKPSDFIFTSRDGNSVTYGGEDKFFQMMMGDTMRKASALGGYYDYWGTKDAIGDEVLPSYGTWLNGSIRGLAGKDWNVDFYSYAKDRVRHVSDIINAMVQSRSQREYKEFSTVLNVITRHNAYVDDYDTLAKKNPDLFKMSRVVGEGESGVKIVSFSKWHLNKAHRANASLEQLMDAYDEMAKYKTAADLKDISNSKNFLREFPNFVKLFNGKIPPSIEKSIIDKNNMETFSLVRRTISDLVHQNIMDMTTYLSVRGIYEKEIEINGKPSQETLEQWNKIWLTANELKSSVSKGANNESPRQTIEVMDAEAARYRSTLVPGTERALFDTFMLGSWQAKTPDSFRNPKEKPDDPEYKPLSAQEYSEELRKLRDATNYSQIGLSLRSIPKASKKNFYKIPDGIFKEALALPDVEMLSSKPSIATTIEAPIATPPIPGIPKAPEIGNAPIITSPTHGAPKELEISKATNNFEETKRRIEEVNKYIEEKQKRISELDSTLLTTKAEAIVMDITETQRMFAEQKKQAGSRVSPKELEDLGELTKIAESIKEHMKHYELTGNTEVPLEGITRGMFFKSVSKMTLNDWRGLDNWFKNMRKPTFIQRVFGDKEGEQALIRKVDYFFFNEAINKRLMRTKITWALDYSPYYDKDGKLVDKAWALKPTATIGRIQDIIGGTVEEGRVQIERRKTRFAKALTPYVASLGEDGMTIFKAEVLRRAAAAAETEATFHDNALERDVDMDVASGFRKDAETHRRALKQLMKKNPVTFGKTYDVNTGTAIVKMNAKDIGEKIRATITEMNKELSLIQKGALDENGLNPLIEKYRKSYDDFVDGKHLFPGASKKQLDEMFSKVDFLDVNSFEGDMTKLLATGRSFPAEIGIDGIIRLERSLALQDELLMASKIQDQSERSKAAMDVLKRFERKAAPHTGELPFDQYFPQVVTDLKTLREQLEPRRIETMQKINQLVESEDDTKAKLEELRKKRDITPDEMKERDELQEKLLGIQSQKDIAINEVIRLNQTMKHGPNAIVADDEMASANRAHELVLQKMAAKTKEEIAEIDRAISWENAAKQVRSQKRREPGQVNFDMDPATYSDHMGNVTRAFHRNLAMVLSKNTVSNTAKRLDMGDATDSWVKFIKLYISDSLGSPTVLTEDLLNDPSMKLQGNIYSQIVDSAVATRLYSIGESLGLINEKEFLGSDDKPGYVPQELKRIDYNTLKRWSQLEAQYEMASLLAHSKSMFANIFGGSQMTMISAGVGNFFKARDINYIKNNINPGFENMTDVERAYIEQGLLEEYMQIEAGMIPKGLRGNFESFFNDAIKMIRKDADVSDQTLYDLAKKHKIADSILDKASWFMRRSERTLRRDAFMAHYISWSDRFGGALKGVYDEKGNWRFNPILAKLATNGVKATQFFYSAPYRPAFARTELGKVLSRFQLWTYNSIQSRKTMYDEAKIYGFKPDSPEMEKFSRMMTADLIVFGLAEAYMFSIFDSTLPAPWNFVNDLANWVFGEKKDKERAFFGAYPYYVAPLQVVTPPALRMFPALISGLATGDWRRVTDYTTWTMFPFGRLARDLHKSYLNPKSFIDRMTGFPLTKIPGPDEQKDDTTGGINK